MRHLRTRTTALLLAGGIAAVATTGTAYAYWSTTGSGTGSATAAAGLRQFSVTASVPSATPFYPGGPAAPLSVTVDNTGNDYTLTVTQVALDTSRQVTVSDAVGTCTNYSISVAPPDGWTGFTVAPNAGSGAQSIPGAVTLTSADSGCQGATFSIPVTLTGHN